MLVEHAVDSDPATNRPQASPSRPTARGALDREPHAALDDASRKLKAAKIVAQLRAERSLEGAAVLDIGCGNGVIARELTGAVGSAGSVVGVDVVDQRTTFEGYSFQCVTGTGLPFGDATFDIVVSNHCIEHVGDRGDQLLHLAEIRRVLRPDGVCYLALPSRWTIVEPHFHLPFLSWLPRSLQDPYVRMARRGRGYDCSIPSAGTLARLVAEAGFEKREITVGALPLIVEIERPPFFKRALLRAPAPLVDMLRALLPTRMYLLWKVA